MKMHKWIFGSRCTEQSKTISGEIQIIFMFRERRRATFCPFKRRNARVKVESCTRLQRKHILCVQLYICIDLTFIRYVTLEIFTITGFRYLSAKYPKTWKKRPTSKKLTRFTQKFSGGFFVPRKHENVGCGTNYESKLVPNDTLQFCRCAKFKEKTGSCESTFPRVVMIIALQRLPRRHGYFRKTIKHKKIGLFQQQLKFKIALQNISVVDLTCLGRKVLLDLESFLRQPAIANWWRINWSDILPCSWTSHTKLETFTYSHHFLTRQKFLKTRSTEFTHLRKKGALNFKLITYPFWSKSE